MNNSPNNGEKREKSDSKWWCSHLSEQEGDGSERKRPAVLIAEIRLITLGPVEHLVIYAGDVENQTHHQRQTCVMDKHQPDRWDMSECQRRMRKSTWQDEEDSRDKRQYGAVGPNVPNIVEHKTDEHEEQTDQGEGRGWTDHLWRETVSQEKKIAVIVSSLVRVHTNKDNYNHNV